MTLGDAARRINDDREASNRAAERLKAEKVARVEAQLREVITPLAREFAEAYPWKRWRGPRSIRVDFAYNEDTIMDGHPFDGRGTATIARNGGFTVEAPLADGHREVIDPALVRECFERVLAQAMTAK